VFEPIRTQKRTVYEKVMHEIRSSIISGKLKPGDKLPPERELAKMLNVSRASVREAIKMLAAEGLVEIKHGQGVFINGMDNPDLLIKKIANFKIVDDETIREFLEIRRVLEIHAAELAAKRASDDQIKQIYELIIETRRLLREKEGSNLLLLAEHDNKFHRLLAESTGNKTLVQIMSSLLDLLLEVRMRCLKIEGRPLKSLNEHEKIAKALLSRNPKAAMEAMEYHIKSVEKDILSMERNGHSHTQIA
jgi:GntR family transcriptional repressor for pyruvate dehydrogenase complex